MLNLLLNLEFSYVLILASHGMLSNHALNLVLNHASNLVLSLVLALELNLDSNLDLNLALNVVLRLIFWACIGYWFESFAESCFKS